MHLPSPRLRRRFPRAQLTQPVRDFPAVTASTLQRMHEAGGLGWGFIDMAHAAHTSGQGFTHMARAPMHGRLSAAHLTTMTVIHMPLLRIQVWPV
jgi:hypothetical protein